MTTYTEQDLIAAVQAGYHVMDDLPLATRSWLEGYRAGRSNPQPVAPVNQQLLTALSHGFIDVVYTYGLNAAGEPHQKYKKLVDDAEAFLAAKPAQQPVVDAVQIVQDCVAMGFLVETVDSSPTHRHLVKRAKALLSAGKENNNE